jgi:hypothetical protein
MGDEILSVVRLRSVASARYWELDAPFPGKNAH